MTEDKMPTLQLIDTDGETVLFEASLGVSEGEWDVFDEDEARQLVSAIRRNTYYPEPVDHDHGAPSKNIRGKPLGPNSYSSGSQG